MTKSNSTKYGLVLVGILSFLTVGFLMLSNSSPDTFKTVEESNYAEATNTDETSNNANSNEQRSIEISGSLEEYTYDDLYNHADTIVIGTVKEILPSKWNTIDGQMNKSANGKIKRGELIYTDIIISIDEYLKNPLSSNEITLRVVGGTIGNISMKSDIEPDLKSGEKVLLYLSKDTYPYTKDVGSEHFVVTGYVQGKFKLADDGKVIGWNKSENITKEELLNKIKNK